MKHGVLHKWKSYWYLQLKDPETDEYNKGFVRSKLKSDLMQTANRWLYGTDGYTQIIDQLHIYDSKGRWVNTTAVMSCGPLED